MEDLHYKDQTRNATSPTPSRRGPAPIDQLGDSNGILVMGDKCNRSTDISVSEPLTVDAVTITVEAEPIVYQVAPIDTEQELLDRLDALQRRLEQMEQEREGGTGDEEGQHEGGDPSQVTATIRPTKESAFVFGVAVAVGAAFAIIYFALNSSNPPSVSSQAPATIFVSAVFPPPATVAFPSPTFPPPTAFPLPTPIPPPPPTQESCSVPEKLQCQQIAATPPVLDGQLTEWSFVQGLESEIHSIFGTTYEMGAVSYKCQYDAQSIYFALEIPGEYRFDTTDNHFCAAIGTMFKIGSKAAYSNMGGCPDAVTGCADGVPDECADYLVDLGAHWELRTTQQGVLYPFDDTTGSGNDLVANNNDEYGVSPFCRFDDDGALAANEWSGAWTHSNPVDGGLGSYKFEISRPLVTASTVTDKQLAIDRTYSFGIAYWDPFESEENGWSGAGHYLTGCASEWIDLALGD